MQISPVAVRTNVNNYKSRNRENVHRSFGNQSSNQSFTGAGSDLVLSFRRLFSAKSRAASEAFIDKVGQTVDAMLSSKNSIEVENFKEIFGSLLESQVSKKAQKSSEEILSRLGEKFGNDEDVVKVAFSQIKQRETAQGTQKLLKAGFNPFIMNSIFDFPVISFLKSGSHKPVAKMLSSESIFRYLPVAKREDSSLLSGILYHFNPFLNNNGFMSRLYDSPFYHNSDLAKSKKQKLQETSDKILKRIPDEEFKKSISETIDSLVKSSLLYNSDKSRKTFASNFNECRVSPMLELVNPTNNLNILGIANAQMLADGLISPEKFKDLFWLNRRVRLSYNSVSYNKLMEKYLSGDSRVDEKYFEQLIDSLHFNDAYNSLDSQDAQNTVFKFIELRNRYDLSGPHYLISNREENIKHFNLVAQRFLQNDIRRGDIGPTKHMIEKIAKLAYLPVDAFDFVSNANKKAYLIRKSLDNISENSYLRMSKLEHYLELVQKSEAMQDADKTLLPDLKAAIEHYKDLPVTKYTNDVKKEKEIMASLSFLAD